MRQIAFKQKMEVIELYLNGLSTNEIAAKTGISKGAVVTILKDAREGKFPGLELKDRIDELHTLSMRLRKDGLDLEQARLGSVFLRRLLDMGIEPDKLREWIDFNLEISPIPPEGFIPAAMELFHIQKATGKSYAEIASEAKELSEHRQQLVTEVQNLKADEIRAEELKGEVDKAQKEVDRLMVEKNKLEDTLRSYVSFIEKRAEKLGISPDEFEARFKELVSLEEEIASNRGEKSRLAGEIEALSETREKLSSRMEKASADFERDITLIKETRDELVRIAEMKGRYEVEVGDMEWADEILPFLRYPDKVDDPDFKLVAAVVGCIDKWLPTHNLGFSWGVKWGDITKYVHTKRAQFR
jgi:predicted  nucleic acid-binding Zn-ribbon protein